MHKRYEKNNAIGRVEIALHFKLHFFAVFLIFRSSIKLSYKCVAANVLTRYKNHEKKQSRRITHRLWNECPEDAKPNTASTNTNKSLLLPAKRKHRLISNNYSVYITGRGNILRVLNYKLRDREESREQSVAPDEFHPPGRTSYS